MSLYPYPHGEGTGFAGVSACYPYPYPAYTPAVTHMGFYTLTISRQERIEIYHNCGFTSLSHTQQGKGGY